MHKQNKLFVETDKTRIFMQLIVYFIIKDEGLYSFPGVVRSVGLSVGLSTFLYLHVNCMQKKNATLL